MLLTDLVKEIFVREGQHLSGDLSRFKLDYDKFWPVARRELEKYQKYRPLKKVFNITLITAPHPYYDFTTDPNNAGYSMDDLENPVYGNIPKWIPKAVPVQVQQSPLTGYGLFSNVSGKFGEPPPGSLGRLIQPVPIRKEYRPPKLYSNMPGKFEVTCMYHYFYTVTESNNAISEVEIHDLGEDDEIFVALVAARFLVAVGRSRRAFTHHQLPISTDGDLLVSEGHDQYKEAETLLHERSYWSKATQY